MFKLFVQRNVTSGHVTLRKREAPHSEEKHHILLFKSATLECLTVFQKGYMLYIYMQLCVVLEMKWLEYGERESKQPEPKTSWPTQEERGEFNWQFLRRKNENNSKTLKEDSV